jgi:hypothetical protein
LAVAHSLAYRPQETRPKLLIRNQGAVMKRVFLLSLILVMFALPPAMAQDVDQWPHLGLCVTSNFFNGEPLKTLYDRLRVEFTPVIQVGSSPDVYALPQIDYATGDGLVRVGGNVFVHVFNLGDWDFYTGGGVSPLQFTTEDQVKINSQGTVQFDFGATRKLYKWTGKDGKEKSIRIGGAIRQEISGQIGSTIPEVQSPTRITTLKIGFIF